MEELYWITTLGNISVACGIISSIGLMIVSIFTVMFLLTDYYNNEEEKKALHKRVLIGTWVVSLILLLCAIFIPSKNDLYVIYGVGSTIDYLKESPTAKSLPEKYIKVLDRIAEKQLEEDE